MLSTVLQSNPAATSELAMAAVTGMAGQFGGGRNVRIVSIDVKEVAGEYIAVATIQVEEPEAEEKQEPKPQTQEDDERIRGSKADPDRFNADPYYLYAHTSEAQSSIPDVGEQAVPETDLSPGRSPLDENVQQVQQERREENDTAVTFGPETLTPQSESLSEKLESDFNAAETAYNVDPRELEAERLAEKPLDRMSPRELEELREEVEARLKNMPPEAIPPVEDGVNPNPSA